MEAMAAVTVVVIVLPVVSHHLGGALAATTARPKRRKQVAPHLQKLHEVLPVSHLVGVGAHQVHAQTALPSAGPAAEGARRRAGVAGGCAARCKGVERFELREVGRNSGGVGASHRRFFLVGVAAIVAEASEKGAPGKVEVDSSRVRGPECNTTYTKKSGGTPLSDWSRLAFPPAVFVLGKCHRGTPRSRATAPAYLGPAKGLGLGLGLGTGLLLRLGLGSGLIWADVQNRN